MCTRLGMKHVWIKLEGANQALLGDKKVQALVAGKLCKLYTNELSQKGTNVMLHCAAGVHRTGTCAFTLLRMSGYEAAESYKMLETIREATYKGVGDHRIELAEK